MPQKIYRFEFKYEVNPKIAYFITKEIQRFGMRLDTDATDNGEYYVTSIYYDSHDLSDYQDKTGGLLRRKKLRIRIYEPYLDKSEKIWLEIKNRFGAKNSKTRLKLTKHEVKSLLVDGGRVLLERSWAADEFSKKNEILWNLIKSSAKPVVAVRYKRRAFVNDLQTIRVTFDSDLEACKKLDLGYTNLTIPVNRNKLVMEVKYNYILPNWFKRIVREYELKADTYSKYEKSLEALHRYNPLLR